MKKIVLALSLAAIIILSGCAFALPEASVTPYRSPVHNPELAETLIEKVQNNADTNTFEGLTYESAYEDVLAKIESDKLLSARFMGDTELLEYPAVVDCTFSGSKGGKLTLCRMDFAISPDDKESAQKAQTGLLEKLDAVLGGREEDERSFWWHNESLHVQMWLDDDSGILNIYICTQGNVPDRYPETPDLFPYQLGTDIYTVYADLTSRTPPERPEALRDSELWWEDEGITIYVEFDTDETGAIRLFRGIYGITLNDMGFEESIGYFESAADGLERVIGTPDRRGYDIFDVAGARIKQNQSALDVLISGSRQYRLVLSWPAISFIADYSTNTGYSTNSSMHLYYDEDYLRGTVNK